MARGMLVRCSESLGKLIEQVWFFGAVNHIRDQHVKYPVRGNFVDGPDQTRQIMVGLGATSQTYTYRNLL